MHYIKEHIIIIMFSFFDFFDFEKLSQKAQKQKIWKVAALGSFLDPNFPWVKISQGIQKSDLKYLISIMIVGLFTNFFGNYCEVNYNLDH